jgi:hypothetical protein
MTSASIMGLVSVGDRSGLRVRRVLSDPSEGIQTGPLCFAASGFSLHAERRIAAGDKDGLVDCAPPQTTAAFNKFENVHPAIGSAAADKPKLKTPWNDGTTHLILSGLELCEKLAALVPPPRKNLVRYHGCLAPHAKNRDKIVPKKPDAEELKKTRGSSKNRLLWAALLARTFGLQMEICAHVCPPPQTTAG